MNFDVDNDSDSVTQYFDYNKQINKQFHFE